MATSKSTLTSVSMCRFCLSKDESLSGIYDKKISITSRNPISLPLQILTCLTVEVFPSDGLPKVICDRCRYFMDAFYRFKQMCRQSDESIMHHIEDEVPLAPVAYPIKLTKIYKSVNGPKKSDKVKTMVTESGATIQVTTSNRQSDSDCDDGENVYNIKIDDGDDEGTDEPACIKVVKSGDQVLEVTKENNETEAPSMLRGADNKFHCKECPKTFTNYSYYSRHIRYTHKMIVHTPHGRTGFGEQEVYSCEQCSAIFETQDLLIYHSAQHATKDLVCPLCKEKFDRVEDVSSHVKTHADESDLLCDLCELVFTTRESLDSHLVDKHQEELKHEQSFNHEEKSSEEDEDDNLKVKEEDGQMVVEIKKPDNYLLPTQPEATQSDESEPEIMEISAPQPAASKVTPAKSIAPRSFNSKTIGILKKAEEVKRKSLQKSAESPVIQKQSKPAVGKPAAADAATPPATADKSLRLLEKELQELKRTNNNRSESKPAAAAKSTDFQRGKRAYPNTPKPRVQEEKKTPTVNKVSNADKKQPERRAVPTKDNKEPKDNKEAKVTAAEKDSEGSTKDKEQKDTLKATTKNGTNDKASPDESIRRSSRSSKVKDYAKLVKENSSDDSTDDDEEYQQAPSRSKKASGQSKEESEPATPQADGGGAAVPKGRGRGRPRKHTAPQHTESPPKVAKTGADKNSKKDKEAEDSQDDQPPPNKIARKSIQPEEPSQKENTTEAENVSTEKATDKLSTENKSDIIKSPTGQTLKKVSMKALPPGIKPMPLPTSARPVPGSAYEQMTIGQKVVKVQKITMSKAEVEAMTRKGLLEVKDGNMVLKPGVKLSSSDVAAIKSSVVSDNQQAGVSQE